MKACQIMDNLIDALANSHDRTMICSILLALGEVASSNNERRIELMEGNIADLLMTIHTSAEGDIDIIRAIMRIYSSLLKQATSPSMPLTVIPLLSASLHIIIGYFLEAFITEILNADTTIAPTLIQLMLHPKVIVKSALRAVGHIIAGDDVQTQTMIDLQVIPSLLWLVDYPDKEVQKEAMWNLSNIAAGNESQKQGIIDAGVISKALSFLTYRERETKAEREIFKEAVWLLGNICTSDSPGKLRFMINENMLQTFYELLKREYTKNLEKSSHLS